MGAEEAQNVLELELQAVGNHLMWVLSSSAPQELQYVPLTA